MTYNSPELVRASLDGDLATVRKLVESGADVNSVGDHGMGPLLTFTPAVMEYLLSQGADPNRQTNESGCPVLIGIAYMNNVECVRLLLSAGADPNAVTSDTGETASTPHCAEPARTSRRPTATPSSGCSFNTERILTARQFPAGKHWPIGGMCALAAKHRFTAPPRMPPKRRCSSCCNPARGQDDPRRERRFATELGELALASKTTDRPARPAGCNVISRGHHARRIDP